MAELAPYAVSDRNSKGRQILEAQPKHRTESQRDRDRIIHSTAFRRLEYKTQVFVNHEGDLFRTRLTHTIEVAQIARTIARALSLNDDLTEAIALAHDLGHTPFGHAGQDALNACMLEFGGFEHNLQSLRTVDRLEERYGRFDGLNLLFETREGILKHCSARKASLLGNIGQRFITNKRPSLEAQICNLADEVAYNSHDIDDGLRSGLIEIAQLSEITLFDRHQALALEEYPGLEGRRLIHEIVRRMIGAQVTDLLVASRGRIAEAQIQSLDDVREAPALIGFSREMAEENRQLKSFLNEKLYRHFQVLRMTTKAQRIISGLFDAFMENVHLLPPQYKGRALGESDDALIPNGRARAVADYIAGMTDRYAVKEHRRLFAIGET